ncbi:MAG: hypothetical protein ACYTF0_01985 [Planctomycetota bacterium]|jgi:hypothetical protein
MWFRRRPPLASHAANFIADGLDWLVERFPAAGDPLILPTTTAIPLSASPPELIDGLRRACALPPRPLALVAQQGEATLSQVALPWSGAAEVPVQVVPYQQAVTSASPARGRPSVPPRNAVTFLTWH